MTDKGEKLTLERKVTETEGDSISKKKKRIYYINKRKNICSEQGLTPEKS